MQRGSQLQPLAKDKNGVGRWISGSGGWDSRWMGEWGGRIGDNGQSVDVVANNNSALAINYIHIG
jgi:hypothetical protein